MSEAAPSQKTRVAVLISGNGGNLQALIDACAAPDYPASISLVISNNTDAYGIKRAQKAGIPVALINHRDYITRETFDAALHDALTKANVEYVCLAGFMRILTPDFVELWQGKMLNMHPSLLPAFKGAHAIRDALAAGVSKTGCTVHYVTAEMDAGPIILQAEAPILPNDTEETLATRIHAEEHRIYVEALAKVIHGTD